MNHDEAKNALPSYHDGELTPDQAEQVEHHLGVCPECREEMADLQHLSAMMAPLSGVENTDYFVQRVMARLPEPTPSLLDRLSGWWRIPVVALSAVLIVSVGSHVAESTPTTRSLLCGETNSTLTHVCADDTTQPDELMNLMWEEK